MMKFHNFSQVPTITQWLISEFKGRRARVGADPKLIPAFRWKLWEKQFGNKSFSTTSNDSHETLRS